MSAWDDTLDAVVDHLNAQSFSETVIFARTYVPRGKITSLTAFRGDVVPKTSQFEKANRNSHRHIREVAVAVSIKIDADNIDAKMDQYMVFVREIALSLLDVKYSTGDVTMEVQNSPVYDYDLLSEQSLFQSMITVTLHRYE